MKLFVTLERHRLIAVLFMLGSWQYEYVFSTSGQFRISPYRFGCCSILSSGCKQAQGVCACVDYLTHYMS